MRFLVLVLFILGFQAGKLRAQTFADWWYFGHEAGIHFLSSGPIFDTNSVMDVFQGCATYSDDFGNLLFYTDGTTVYDATHSVMLNGNGLLGNGAGGSSCMSSFIVPRPLSATEYYLFTIKKLGDIYYSKIDMSLNGGLGGVVTSEKNILLIEDTPEKLVALRQPNNIDYWLVTFKMPGDTVVAFEIDENGLDTSPVESYSGFNWTAQDVVGYLKANQQNNKLATTTWKAFIGQNNANKVHVFDFDNATGSASYDLSITPSVSDTFNYGIEFSPSGQYLYVQSYWVPDTRQYDLLAGNEAAINASEVLVGLGYSGSDGGAMQLGPDGKIYISRNAAGYLSRINDPDVGGSGCNFEYDAVFLDTKFCGLGLPQFVPFFIQGDLELAGTCFGEPTDFQSTYLNADSVHWDFGDPATGSLNESTLPNPSHLFSDTGTFSVTLIAFDGFLSDTTIWSVHIFPEPSLDLGPDTLLCLGETWTADVSQPYSIVVWNETDTSGSIAITSDSTIEVQIFTPCDTLRDSIVIRFEAPLALDLGPDTILCTVSALVIGEEITVPHTAIWSTGATTDTIVAVNPGVYELTISNVCGEVSDELEIEKFPAPIATLPGDTQLCSLDPFVLKRPEVAGVQYTWSDSSAGVNFRVRSSGLFWLAAENECGFSVDSIRVVMYEPVVVDLGEDTNVCETDSIRLGVSWPGATYAWNTGDTADSIWTAKETFRYIVTVRSGPCEARDGRTVNVSELFCEGIDCSVHTMNTFTPNGDGVNDIWRIWSDCDIYSYDVRIYNRWGQLVTTSSNVAFGWDGTVSGQLAPSGVYYYVIEFRDSVVVNVDRSTFQGSITLIR